MKKYSAYAPSRLNRRYNLRPDLPDKRDLYFRFDRAVALPPRVDLRPTMSLVEDQGSLGSCTANAWVGLIEHIDKSKDGHYHNWSRLFLYYNERALRGETQQDGGAFIRDGAKALAKYGICRETHWKYDISKFAEEPPSTCYAEALTHLAVKYERVQQLEGAILAAVAQGNPVVIGFTVYESFESDAVSHSGMVPIPAHSERVLGGHAVLIVGYDRDKQLFTVRNSWGSKWGDHGYCYFPFAYLLDGDLAEDFWTMTELQSMTVAQQTAQ